MVEDQNEKAFQEECKRTKDGKCANMKSRLIEEQWKFLEGRQRNMVKILILHHCDWAKMRWEVLGIGTVRCLLGTG